MDLHAHKLVDNKCGRVEAVLVLWEKPAPYTCAVLVKVDTANVIDLVPTPKVNSKSSRKIRNMFAFYCLSRQQSN